MTGVVVVTGGVRGIGRAVADRFARENYRVAVCSRSAPVQDLPAEWLQGRVDIRQRSEMESFFRQVVDRWGALDVLVNAAGISRWRPVEKIDEDFVEEVIQTSVLGTLWSCAGAVAALHPGGCIVNISSLAGKRGSANNSAYCAAKFAVNGITQALAKELGPRGIRVNAVCPVYVRTEQLLVALNENGSPVDGKSPEDYLEWFSSTQTALGRLPKASEVAETVYYLASPAASAITGQCINVDCGVLPQ